MKKSIAGSLVLLLLVGMAGTAAAAEQPMTREEYKAKLAEYAQREADARAEIEKCDAHIQALRQQLKALNKDIASLNSQTLLAVDASEVEIAAFEMRLESVQAELENLMGLAPEEILHRRPEMDALSSQLADLSGSQIAALPELAEKLAATQNLLMQLEQRRPRSMSIEYEVVRGDNLWNIAKKETIYNDPFMWPRLYRANRENIKDPNLIFPKQILAVPFGVAENQYLVSRGDFLTAIAEEVYNDPTKWHKIYKANSEQIVEPSMIFPAQVFEIPAN